MLGSLAALPVLLQLLKCPAMIDPAVDPALACFVDQTPPCAEGRAHCVGIHLHLVVGREGLITSPEWTADALAHAQWLFEPVDVGFQVVAVDRLGPEWTHIATREQRDAIGKPHFSRGVVHVFVVAQLDDVDIPGEQIRGLHWRQRSNIDKRWIILSRVGSKIVLGHELGHFFGLPHSRYRDSIMNKAPREQPPWDQRVFVPDELAIVRTQRDNMLASGMLVDSTPRTQP